MTETNFKLIIEYDGTHYHGWQRQRQDRTIQGEIEAAIQKMTRQKITLIGSGRTDAGVHALAQVANFRCQTDIKPDALLAGLNSLLPSDVVIKHCQPVASSFHARYQVQSKIYRYRIRNHSLPSALGRDFEWHVRKQLKLSEMQNAVACIPGTYDFKAFEGAGSPRNDTIRTIFQAQLVKIDPDHLVFTIQANGFLRFMVRNIVGTLVAVGLQKISAGEFKKILLSKDRNLAGPTAPPQGLVLVQVIY